VARPHSVLQVGNWANPGQLFYDCEQADAHTRPEMGVLKSTVEHHVLNSPLLQENTYIVYHLEKPCV